MLLSAFLIPLKTILTLAQFRAGAWGIDGGYYLDIAQNVRDGLGFATDVSPFNQGLPYFPHPSPVYPLWPLLLGYLARVFPLEILASWLGFFLYFAAVALAWSYGKQLFPRARAVGWGFEVNAGIVLAAMLAFHRFFFEVTGKPYTEGLTYVLLMVALIRSLSALRSVTLRAGLELGLWSGALFLCRSQLVVFLLGAAATLLVFAASGEPRRALRALLGLILAFSAVILPEMLFIRGFTDANPLWVFFRFDQFQATALLPPFRPLVLSGGPLGTILDRLRGVFFAFSPSLTGFTYYRAYGLFAVALPLALPGLFRSLLRGRHELSREWVRCRLPEIFFVVFALIAMLSVHAVHMKSGRVWLFGARQGLASCFALFLGFVLLLSRPGMQRKLAVTLFVCSSIFGVSSLTRQTFVAAQSDAHQGEGLKALIEWVNRVATPGAERQIFAVPFDLGKTIAPYTPGAAYQEFSPNEWFSLAPAFADGLGVRFWVLATGSLDGAPPADRAWFELHFEKLNNDLSGYETWRRRS